jgi:hypothetical protein
LTTTPTTAIYEVENPAYKAEADVGSRAWAGRIRHRARALAEQVETGYLELGEILYRIYDAPVDGDPAQGSVLQKWGYKSIGEYAEKELSLHYKKAQRLVRIFYRVEVELDGLGRNPELKKRFIRLGWSKARELVRVLTKENAVEWILRAESMNYTTLVEVIKRTIAANEANQIKADIARLPDPIAESNRILPPPEETVAEVLGAPTGKLPAAPAPAALPLAAAPPTATPVRPRGDYTETTSDAFVDRKWVSKVFSLESEQAETVNLALKRAQDLASETKSPSTLLSLICLDFLSGADWTGTTTEQRLRYLAKIEKSVGLRLVVVDDNNTVVYGLGALADAARAAKANTDTDDEAEET